MKSILIAAIVALLVSGVWAEEKIPEKVTRVLERMKTLQNNQRVQAVLDHLGLMGDKKVKFLDGWGSLGSNYEFYSLGVGDEWGICIDYTIKFDDPEKQAVFMVIVQRGSIKKLKKNLAQDWKIFYPYWLKGKMITESEDKIHKTSNNEPDKTTADPPGVKK